MEQHLKEWRKLKMENSYCIETQSFNIYINGNVLVDITSLDNTRKISDKTFTKEDSKNLIQELIFSRVASETIIHNKESEISQLKEELSTAIQRGNKYEDESQELYDRLSDAERTIDKFRGESA